MKKNQINTKNVVGFILIFLILQITSFSQNLPQSHVNSSIHVALGVPKDADESDDNIINRAQYVLSYNYSRNVPNWVSWELNKKWYGKAIRYKGRFITDKTLPSDFYRVNHSDYTGSGYDRGHMVRSEERSKNAKDNKSTFYLTNIIPQKEDLNRGVWLDFEMFCEKLCKEENKELFVIAGGIFHTDNSIDELVSIPDSCFKIVVILESNQTIIDINENTPVIAVVMPNINGIRKNKWETYITTVKQIENSTGYDFLSKIKQNIQAVLEIKKYQP